MACLNSVRVKIELKFSASFFFMSPLTDCCPQLTRKHMHKFRNTLMNKRIEKGYYLDAPSQKRTTNQCL